MRENIVKKLMICLISFMFIFFLSGNSLSALILAEQWIPFQNSHTRDGTQVDTLTEFERDVFTSTTISNVGIGQQDQIIDLDNDGIVDIILFEENDLQIYSYENGIATKQAEVFNIGTLKGNIAGLDYDNDNLIEFIMIMNVTDSNVAKGDINQDMFTIWEFNDSNITLVYNHTIFNNLVYNETGNNVGVACRTDGNDDITFDDGFCTFINNGNQLAFVDLGDLTMSFSSRAYGFSYNDYYRTPLIEDLGEDDSDFEVIFICDEDGDQEDGYCVIDLSTKEFDTNFNSIFGCTGLSNCRRGVGFLDDLVADSSDFLLEPVITDVDNDGDFELVGTVYGNSDLIQVVSWEDTQAFDVAVTTLQSGGGVSPIGSLLVNDFDNDGKDDIYIMGGGVFQLFIVDISLPGILLTNQTGGANAPASSNIAGRGYYTLADLNNDGVKDIITPNGAFEISINGKNPPIGIVDFNTSNLIDIKRLDTSRENTPSGIPVDLDQDGFLEIIYTEEYNTYIIDNNVSNQKPIISELVSNTGNPICVNQIATYQLTYNDNENDAVYTAIDCFDNITTASQIVWSNARTFAPIETCNHSVVGQDLAVTFYIIDQANRFDSDVNTDFSRDVSIGNCFDSGEGEVIGDDITDQAQGFSEYGLNDTFIESLIGTGETDNYNSKVFDWSLCQDWFLFRGICPFWIWVKQGLNDLWNFIFTFFWIFLMFIVVLLVGAIMFKKRFGNG